MALFWFWLLVFLVVFAIAAAPGWATRASVVPIVTADGIGTIRSQERALVS